MGIESPADKIQPLVFEENEFHVRKVLISSILRTFSAYEISNAVSTASNIVFMHPLKNKKPSDTTLNNNIQLVGGKIQVWRLRLLKVRISWIPWPFGSKSHPICETKTQMICSTKRKISKEKFHFFEGNYSWGLSMKKTELVVNSYTFIFFSTADT